MMSGPKILNMLNHGSMITDEYSFAQRVETNLYYMDTMKFHDPKSTDKTKHAMEK